MEVGDEKHNASIALRATSLAFEELLDLENGRQALELFSVDLASHDETAERPAKRVKRGLRSMSLTRPKSRRVTQNEGFVSTVD